MPRISRQYSEIKVYHVILRGIDKQDIFLDDEDREKFLELLQEKKEKFDYEVYVYCLMDNHVHMIIYDKKSELSKLMQSITINYVMYFNRKYDRVGHLFQNRFFSKKIEDKKYLLQACRYIHQNPLKAEISKTEEYKWSSYNEYIKKEKIINSKMILSIFSKEDFIEFHKIYLYRYDLNEYEMGEKFTDNEVHTIICKLFNISNAHEILNMSNTKRNEAVCKIKEILGVPNTQLARIIGINRNTIQRAINTKLTEKK